MSHKQVGENLLVNDSSDDENEETSNDTSSEELETDSGAETDTSEESVTNRRVNVTKVSEPLKVEVPVKLQEATPIAGAEKLAVAEPKVIEEIKQVSATAVSSTNANANISNADRTSMSNKETAPDVSEGRLIANEPNDEAYVVHDSRNIVTPRSSQTQPVVKSPTGKAGRLPSNAAPSTNANNGVLDGSSKEAVQGGVLVSNAPIDERIDVNDADAIPTPRERSVHREDNKNEEAGRQILHNAPHDEIIMAPRDTREVKTPISNRQAALAHRGGAMRHDHSNNDDDEEEEESEEEEEDEEEEIDNNNINNNNNDNESGDDGNGNRRSNRNNANNNNTKNNNQNQNKTRQSNADDHRDDEQRAEGYAGQKPEALEEANESTMQSPSVFPKWEYDPAKYAETNATLPAEVRDLFKLIQEYEPETTELQAKLLPFIPDYIPAIGDLDPFVKINRPDDRPDGLGLYVVDEPTIPQSNPAVVQLELRATNVRGGVAAGSAVVVDSFEDAANRPEVIDRWIADVKKVHYKKPLPTVTYQKPMPEIEHLMQLWPQKFEELLNSDIQFPPPSIDLDMDQYVRTLCALLDIPTYNSTIESLHVMFTLYEEFMANQHFQSQESHD